MKSKKKPAPRKGLLYLMAGFVGVSALTAFLVLRQPTQAVVLGTNTTGGVLPVDDARVVKSESGANYGKSTYLQVDGGDQERWSYLKFNVSGTPTSAKLMLYTVNPSNKGPYVYTTSNGWSEGSINWKNKPALGNRITSATKVDDGEYLSLDVSSVVKGSGTYSFALTPRSNDGLSFYSRANTSHPPLLVLNGTNVPNSPVPPSNTPRPQPTSTTAPGQPSSTPRPTATNTPRPSPTTPPSASNTPRPSNTVAPTATVPPLGPTATLPPTSGGAVKLAFIGDSGDGGGFQSVLNLIKSEHADGVVHSGDMSYNSNTSTFFNMINNTLGASYPYFYAVGNHDTGYWGNFATDVTRRLAALGITPTGSASGRNYSIVFRGIKLVFTDAKNSSYVQTELGSDNHTWKVCSQHFVQTYMHVGDKGNESSWPMYETCRKNGALIATAHSHTYSRTKTMSSIASETSLVTTSDPQDNVKLSRANGTTFAFTNGTGGNGLYDWSRCKTSAGVCSIFATSANGNPIAVTATNSGAYGVLFITFGNGGANTATAYFKDVNGKIWDQFTITAN